MIISWESLRIFLNNLYRLSTLSWSTGTIDTYWEKVDCCKTEEIVSTIGNNGSYVGEQSSEELSYCLLEPETRNILQLSVEDIDKTNRMFKDLYGRAVEPRLRFLNEHLEEANVD